MECSITIQDRLEQIVSSGKMDKITSVKLKDKIKRVIGFFNMFEKTFKNFSLNIDELDERNIYGWTDLIDNIVGIKGKTAEDSIPEDISIKFMNKFILGENNPQNAAELEEAILKRVSNDATNAEKLAAFINVSYDYYIQYKNFFGDILPDEMIREAGESLISQVNETIATKSAENTKEREVILPNNNSASIFGNRGVTVPLNMFYPQRNGEHPATFSSMKFNNIFKAITYIKAVYAYGIDSVHNKNGEKSLYDEILSMQDSDAVSFYNNINIKDENYANKYKDNVPWILNELISRSFSDDSTSYKNNLDNAIKFLKSNIPLSGESTAIYKAGLNAETEADNLIDLYNAILSQNASDYIDNYGETNRKITFNVTGVSFEEILSNPHRLYVISNEAKELIDKIEKHEEATGTNVDNVVVVNKRLDISNDEDDGFVDYHDGISKDTDGVMVFTSSKYGYSTSTAKIAKEQGRFRTLDVAQESPVNKMTFSRKGFALEMVGDDGKPLEREMIVKNIRKLYYAARTNKNKKFLIPYTETGLEKTDSGYSGDELMSMFIEAGGEKGIPKNVSFSFDWAKNGNFKIERYKKFVKEGVVQLIRQKSLKISGDGISDVEIDRRSFLVDKEKESESAYNTYLMNVFEKMAGKTSVIDENIAAVMAVRERKSSMERVNQAFNVIKKCVFNDLAKEIRTKKAQGKELFTIGELTDVIPFLLMEADSSIQIKLNHSNIVKYNILSESANRVHSYITNKNNIPAVLSLIGNSNAMYQILEEKAKSLCFSEKVTSQTKTALYMPPRETFSDVEEYNRVLNSVVAEAKRILDSGGKVITLSNKIMSNKSLLYQRTEEANKDVWNELYNSGYMPEYDTLGVDVWSSKVTLNDSDKEIFDKKLESLKEKLHTLTHFTPSVTNYENGNIISSTVILSNNMFGNLSDSISNGVLTFEKTDALYEQIFALEKILVDKDATGTPVRCNLTIPATGSSYYSQITYDNIRINPDESISIVADFKIIKNLEDYSDVDTSWFDKLRKNNVSIKNDNLKLKLGAKRYNDLTSNIVKNLGEYLSAFAEQDIEKFENSIKEAQEESLRIWKTDMSSMSKDEKDSLTKKKKELDRTARKYTRIIEKLRNGDYVDYLNNWEYIDEDGKKWTGILGYAKQVINSRYGEYAFLEKDSDKYNEKVLEKEEDIKGLYLEKNQDVDVHTYHNDMKEIHQKSLEIIDSAIEASNVILSNIDEFISISFKRFGRKYGLRINTQVSLDKTADPTMKVERQEDSNFNSGEENNSEDANSEIQEDGVKFLDNYQAETQDIKKSLSQQVKELLGTVFVRNDDKLTGYIQLDEMGDILYQNPDNVYNFLRENLTSVATYEEMENWIGNYVRNGHFEYADLLSFLIEGSDNLKTKFFVAMHTQSVQRVSGTIDKFGVDKMYDDNKDMRIKKLSDITSLCIGSRQKLVPEEADEYNFIGATAKESMDRANSVAEKLRTLTNKFEKANKEFKEKNNDKTSNDNIFLSQKDSDVELINEVVDTITYSLQGIGIPVSQKMIRDSITSPKEFFSLMNALTSRNKGFYPNISAFGRSSEITEYNNRKYDYQNIFEVISTALYDTPQKGTVHANGKDYASYMYPSFSSILFDKLNDNSIGEDGRRKNMKFIEDNFMKYPIFYKEDNLDEIRKSLNKEYDKYTDLLDLIDENAISNAVRESFVDQEKALEGKEGYVYTNNKTNKDEYVSSYDAIPMHIKTNKRKKIVQEIIQKYKDNGGLLPDNCPLYQGEIWRNEWLKTIYKNYTNISHKSKKEKWERITTSYLTALNKKEYKNLTKAEYEQFLITSFLTTCKRTGFKFGSFYSPMVSDAEVCRMETFALMDGLSDVKDEANRKGLMPIALLAAKKLKKVVEAEMEMSDAIMQRYILRLESYNEYNNRIRNGENIKYWDCEGYSEPISMFDIKEARTFVADEQGHYLIDLSGLVFDENGKLDTEKSHDAIFGTDDKSGRILDFNAYKPSHYIDVDTSGSIDLETQCYNELIKQFAIYLEGLSENTTVPSNRNINLFTKKSSDINPEVYTNEFYEDEEPVDSLEDSDEDIDDVLSQFVSNEELEASKTMRDILIEKNKLNSLSQNKQVTNTNKNYVGLNNYDIFKYVNKDALPLISRFFFEQAYANTQLQQLFNTSPAFYKAGNIVEVQKRGKEHNTPMIRLDLSRLKSPIQKSIILKDIDMDSLYQEFKDIVNESDNLSSADKKAIIAAYSSGDNDSMKITDGQAYRSPSGYKKIMEGLGRWDDIKEAAYNKLMYTNEPITFNDIQSLILNPVKGFNFSMEEVNLTPDYKILKPTQYKDSEAILLYAAFARRRKSNEGSLVEQGSVLSGLVDFMEENDIDCAVFESCVKEGGQGAVDISSASSAEEAKIILKSACFYSNGSERDDVIHKTSWADYGIVSETPEHFFEEEAVFGTQIRRIMSSDLIPSRIYNIVDPLTNKPLSDKGLSGREIMNKYSDLIGKVLYDDFVDLKELFNDNDKLEDFLLREVSGNPLYPSDIAEYCKYNRKTGEFDKLGNPKNYAKTQQLLLSLFKNRITRQKISGGSCVQVSVSYMNQGLDIKFAEVIDSDGKKRKIPIEAECYLPAYMESIYEKFLKYDGTIDFEAMKKYYRNDIKTFNALTSMVGYRIPTEGLSSTLKLKVKGFTNNYTGSSIILPKEIVTLSGSDFDIDKMYIHRFSFKEDKDGYPQLMSLEDKNTYDENDRRERKEAYNNEIVKMMMGIMTLPENAMLMIKPQGFDNLKKSAAIANIVKQPGNKYTISELREMPLKQLKKLSKFDSGLSFLNPATQTYFQQQNMVGKNSLGIWAVARSGHCLFENSGIFLRPEYVFDFNSQTLRVPDPITVRRNGVDMYLAPEIGSFVGASADNAKDPVLAKLGITTYNIDVAVYLARMGLDSTSMALMLQNQFFSINQFTPILNYFDKRFSATITKPGTQIAKEEYEAKLNEYHKSLVLDRETVLGIQYNDDLMVDINADVDAISDDTIKVDYKTRDGNIIKREFTRKQIAYAIASLSRDVIAPAKNQLNQLTLALRSDSQNGAVKAGMAGTCSRIQQIEAAELIFNSAISVFNFDETFNTKTFFRTDFDASKNIKLEDRERTNIGFVQDFTDYGVLSVRELTKGKLPHFGATFSNAFKIGKHMSNRYISEKNAKSLESALFYYHFGNIPFFGNETVEENGVKYTIKREDKIKMYKENMCALYWQAIAMHPELLDNKFVSMLRPDPPLTEEDKENGKIQVLRMPGSNQLDDEAKTDLGIAFLELLKSIDPSIRAFGEHLVRYSFYRQGFQFLPDGYMNIIPNEVFESLEGYNNVLAGLITTDKDKALKNGNFIEQFLLNNINAIKSLNQINEAEFMDKEFLSTPEKIIEMFGYIPKYICTRSKAGYALKRFNSKTGNYVYARGYKEQSLAKDNKYFVEYTYFPTQEFMDLDVDPSSVKAKKVTYSSYFEEQTDKYYEALTLIGAKGEYNGQSIDEIGKMAAQNILGNMQSALDRWLQQDVESNKENGRLDNITQDSSDTHTDKSIEDIQSCKL